MNIFDVMEYGAIVHHNEEFGILITANGSLLNWWNEDARGAGQWVCVDCRGFNLNDPSHWGIIGLPLYDVMDRAEEWVEEELASIVEQQDSDPLMGMG